MSEFVKSSEKTTEININNAIEYKNNNIIIHISCEKMLFHKKTFHKYYTKEIPIYEVLRRSWMPNIYRNKIHELCCDIKLN